MNSEREKDGAAGKGKRSTKRENKVAISHGSGIKGGKWRKFVSSAWMLRKRFQNRHISSAARKRKQTDSLELAFRTDSTGSRSHLVQSRQYQEIHGQNHCSHEAGISHPASLTQPQSQHIIVHSFLLRLNCDDGIIRRILLIKFLI